MISASTQRIIVRWLHLILVIPIIGYIYSPFEQLPDYAPVVRFIAFPVIFLSGLWMWIALIRSMNFTGTGFRRDQTR